MTFNTSSSTPSRGHGATTPWLALLFLAWVTLPGQAQPPATLVGVDTVAKETMAQTIPVIGRIVSPQMGEVAARIDGPVAQVFVRVGDVVEQGATLATLDTARIEARHRLAVRQVEEFSAQLDTAKAIEDLARKQLDRLERLKGSPAYSQSTFDERFQEWAVARARRQETEAKLQRGQVRLELAQTDLDDATVKAPYPGTVIRRYVAEGAWLEEGESVVTLVNDSELELEADVPASRLRGLTVGQPVDFTLNDGSRHRAVVRAIVPDESPAARTRPVRFVPAFNVMETPLALNQDVTLLLPVDRQREAVTVSKDAVIRRGDQAVVYVVENGVANPKTVELGEAMGGWFRVLGGLNPGDIVVVRGNERLRPGQPVRFELKANPGRPAVTSASGGQS